MKRNPVSRKINWVFCFMLKREVTKVLSTGALEASVSRFDSDLPDKNGLVVKWLSYLPVTQK